MLDSEWQSDPAIKTKPLLHQWDEYCLSRDQRARGILWEMGLGKTKLVLDTASHLHQTGKIDAVLVIAPNATYPNWLRIEAPIHLAANYIPLIYPKTDDDEDYYRRLVFLDPDFERGRLRVLAISFDAIAQTERAFEFLTMFVKIYRTLIVVDESTAIKNPKAKTTIRVKKLGQLCHYRRILSGTPVANSPFDIHQQIDFLNPDFWGWHGLKSYSAFRAEFGVFATIRVSGRFVMKPTGQFRQLDRLNKMVEEMCTRLTKEDSGVELPPKVFSIRSFDLTPRQRHVYDEVRKRLWAELESGKFDSQIEDQDAETREGRQERRVEIDARLAVTRLMRLHQIASGFVTADEITSVDAGSLEMPELRLILKDKVVADIVPVEENPRLELLRETLDEIQGKVIIWARFTREIDQICAMLGDKALRYDGGVSDRQRQITLDRFRDPKDPAVYLVANQASISHGVTLIIAPTLIYYSNSYSLEKRLQSEDRSHRIGQKNTVHIIDFAAHGTVDVRQLEKLRAKYDVAAQVTGDEYREWIRPDDARN